MKAKTYTIAELQAATAFSEIKAPTKTGVTDAVRYKIVPLAPSEPYEEAIMVSHSGGPIRLILQPEHRSQFLHQLF